MKNLGVHAGIACGFIQEARSSELAGFVIHGYSQLLLLLYEQQLKSSPSNS